MFFNVHFILIILSFLFIMFFGKIIKLKLNFIYIIFFLNCQNKSVGRLKAGID